MNNFSAVSNCTLLMQEVGVFVSYSTSSPVGLTEGGWMLFVNAYFHTVTSQRKDLRIVGSRFMRLDVYKIEYILYISLFLSILSKVRR